MEDYGALYMYMGNINHLMVWYFEIALKTLPPNTNELNVILYKLIL